MVRQKMLERPTPPEFHCVIGEAALSLAVGGPEVMVNQLRRLQELRQNSAVSISVLPLAAGPHRSLGHSFLILQFNDAELSDLLHREVSASEESTIRDDAQLISDHLNQFIELQAMSVSGPGFDALVERIIETHHRES